MIYLLGHGATAYIENLSWRHGGHMVGRGEFVFMWLMIAVTVLGVASILGPASIRDYQTLITGLLALGAATAGAALLHRQIGQAERHEKERRQSRREAARSVLPFTLAALNSYAMESGTAVRRMADAGNRPLSRIPDMPQLPSTAVGGLKEMTELSDPAEAAIIAQIPILMQYQHDRLARSIGTLGPAPEQIRPSEGMNLRHYALDAAELHARSEGLFEFARKPGSRLTKGATYERARSALVQMGFNEIEHPTVYDLLNERCGGDLESPIADIKE